MSDGIVLLHGILRSGRQMRRLAAFLEESGYRTLNLTYPSTRLTLEDIVEVIRPEITRFAGSLTGHVHFLGFSMGGLVIRAYLHRFRPYNTGRVVMLGTPNHGSEVADILKSWWLYRKFYGPAGQQLVTHFKQTDQLFGQVDYELGVIAGDYPFDPLAARVIGKPNDGKVSVESTQLEGMKDHTVVRVWHTFFPVNRKAWRQALQFFKEGRFSSATH